MDIEVKHRARTMEEFRSGQRRFVEAATAAAAAAPTFEPRPTDVIISPYSKCGTTMLQQMFHTLRTGGDMDFDDISRVVPWLEMSPVLGIDLNLAQRAAPRGFKSHLSFTSLPPGTRYLVSLRDPKDSFMSMFRFMEGWFMEPGAISVEEFFEGWIKGRGPAGEGYFDHLLSWWAVRREPNVLLFSYRKMVADPAAHIGRLAAFIGIELDDELLELTVERTCRAWMLAHKDRFDDKLMREMSETKGGLPAGSDSAKVCSGPGTHGDEIPSGIAARINQIWSERITAALGYSSFAELEAEL